MIDHIHKKFLRWAEWVLAPTQDGDNGWSGTNLLQRIREGKGTLMPGAPNKARIPVDAGKVVLTVNAFVESLGGDKRLIKVFYLSRGRTSEEKAARLKIDARRMYERIDAVHRKFEEEGDAEAARLAQQDRDG